MIRLAEAISDRLPSNGIPSMARAAFDRRSFTPWTKSTMRTTMKRLYASTTSSPRRVISAARVDDRRSPNRSAAFLGRMVTSRRGWASIMATTSSIAESGIDGTPRSPLRSTSTKIGRRARRTSMRSRGTELEPSFGRISRISCPPSAGVVETVHARRRIAASAGITPGRPGLIRPA